MNYIIKTEREVVTIETTAREVTLSEYIGEIIRKAREAKGFNRTEISRLTLTSSIKANGSIPGVSNSTISLVEAGKTSPSMNTLEILCDVLDLHISELFPPKETD